jgi:hypothetical protein
MELVCLPLSTVVKPLTMVHAMCEVDCHKFFFLLFEHSIIHGFDFLFFHNHIVQ